MKSNDAKSAIFASIREHLAQSAPFDAFRREHHPHAEEIGSPVISHAGKEENLAETFCENLISIGGNCEIVAGKAQAVDLVRALIEQKTARKIAVSDAALIGEIKDALETNAEILPNAAREDLFDCDLGLTSAQFGIAETGTLVIASTKEFNRLTSLVPPVHVCVLETGKIRRNLGEVLDALERDLSPAVTFITGPSRTSDIELTLAIGVHGPAELFVILIDENKK